MCFLCQLFQWCRFGTWAGSWPGKDDTQPDKDKETVHCPFPEGAGAESTVNTQDGDLRFKSYLGRKANLSLDAGWCGLTLQLLICEAKGFLIPHHLSSAPLLRCYTLLDQTAGPMLKDDPNTGTLYHSEHFFKFIFMWGFKAYSWQQLRLSPCL